MAQNELNDFMVNYCKENPLFNGSVFVVKGDEVLLSKGYGMADYENNIENTPETVFEVGSITKQFTAMAILMLEEEGKLTTDDTLDKYIPDYPNGNKIKIFNLLTHTSGIPEYLEFVEDLSKRDNPYTQEDLVNIFKNEELRFETGSEFSYSNSNYILLGCIIEQASDMKYEDYIRENIFKPLNMNSTGFLGEENVSRNKAIGYDMPKDDDNDIYVKSIEVETTLPYSAGAMCSTTLDLYKWSQALSTETLVKQETLDKMFTPYLDNYALGVGLLDIEDESKIISHSGGIPGYTAILTKNITKDYTVIVLSNRDEYEDIHNLNLGLINELEVL